MGYQTYCHGPIEIDPPLPLDRVQESRFRPTGGDNDANLVFVIDAERGAIQIEPRYDDGVRGDQVEEELAEIVAAFPDHQYSGEFYMEGEDRDDLWRLSVVDGKVHSAAATISWPDDEPAVRRMLDLSTQHLPQELGVDGLGGVEAVLATPLPHGWLMWVPDDPQDSAQSYDEPMPDVVLAVQLFARAHGCDYVLFDADAPTCAGLPTWEW